MQAPPATATRAYWIRLQSVRIELTQREWEVAQRLVRGDSNKQIARHLGLSEFTARDHVSGLMRKLGARTRTDLAAKLVGAFDGQLLDG
jgi:DNA-binding NarL/FixJ family response regulator